MPSWLSTWQPEEAAPDENCWKHLEGTKDDSLAARWRQGPPSDAVEILELERQKELEMWAEFRRKNEEKKKAREALREDFARLCRERDSANRSKAAKPELQIVDPQEDEEEEDAL